MSLPSRIAVTGASGYIGRRLVAMARERGIAVVTLGRRADVAWELGLPLPAGALDGVVSLIHLAHQWNSDGTIEDDVNVRGGIALIEAARKAGVGRIVLGSTVSARAGALNRYGRLKFHLEQALSGSGEVAARIGLVYGGPALSQWGTLLKLTRLPVLPMLDPGTPVQPIHLDEVCDGLLRLAGLADLGQTVFGLCGADPVSFGHFLTETARICHRRALPILPIASGLALALVDLARHIPGLPRVDRERILGMRGLPFQDSRADLTRLGLALRPLASGLEGENAWRRRVLLAEARAVLGAVLGAPPSRRALCLYVAGVGDADPIRLPPLADRCPLSLAACEPLRAEGSPLAARLALAARVIEALPEGQARFRPRLAGVLATGLREMALMPLRLLFGRWW